MNNIPKSLLKKKELFFDCTLFPFYQQRPNLTFYTKLHRFNYKGIKKCVNIYM